jgi:hypothetical protein
MGSNRAKLVSLTQFLEADSYVQEAAAKRDAARRGFGPASANPEGTSGDI